jgi:hypothetical protein
MFPWYDLMNVFTNLQVDPSSNLQTKNNFASPQLRFVENTHQSLDALKKAKANANMQCGVRITIWMLQ